MDCVSSLEEERNEYSREAWVEVRGKGGILASMGNLNGWMDGWRDLSLSIE